MLITQQASAMRQPAIVFFLCDKRCNLTLLCLRPGCQQAIKTSDERRVPGISRIGDENQEFTGPVWQGSDQARQLVQQRGAIGVSPKAPGSAAGCLISAIIMFR